MDKTFPKGMEDNGRELEVGGGMCCLEECCCQDEWYCFLALKCMMFLSEFA